MDRNIKLFALLNFLTDFKFHSAVLIIYFSNITGSYTAGMSLFGVMMVASALFEVPTGMYSDLIGRKKTILFGALSATTSAVFYALGGSYPILFIGAIFDGLSHAWYSGNNEAFLYDSLAQSGKKNTYAQYLGKTSAMFQLALMIGGVIGSVIAQWSFPIIMWLSVIPQFGCVLVSLFLIEPKAFTKGKSNIFGHISRSLHTIWKNAHLRLLSIQEILRYGIGESSFVFNSAFIQTVWPIWAIGFSRFMTFGGASLSFWYSSRIIKKLGEHNVIITANILTRTVNLIAYGFPSVLSPILMGLLGLTYGASTVSNSSLMQKEFTDQERATISSITSLGGKLFYGIASLGLGFIADVSGPAFAMIVAQVFMFGVLILQIRAKQIALYSQ